MGATKCAGSLLASALYWLREFTSTDSGSMPCQHALPRLFETAREWVPNIHGGRENLEAIAFLRQLNLACYTENPGIMMMAEESTAFPSVSRPTDQGGLGFGFKWNMGWMHDFLVYMAYDPIHRRYHHGEATFSMAYAFNENFVLPLSHDEVVHGKGSLIGRCRETVGSSLPICGCFWLGCTPTRVKSFSSKAVSSPKTASGHTSAALIGTFCTIPSFRDQATRQRPQWSLPERGPLHELDHQSEGFQWIDYLDSLNSTFSFLRRSRSGGEIR
ncbi:MAG: hypothetical protein R3F31_26520 [Verrucomicrobiales bacterium]